MTLITPETAGPQFDDDVTRIKAILEDLKGQIEGLMEQARAGEVDNVKEAGKPLQELRAWMRIAMETEKALEDYKNRKSGSERGYALDLDAAREQIRCRLDRVTRCCRQRKVSG